MVEWAIPGAALIFSAASLLLAVLLNRTKAPNGRVGVLEERVRLLEKELEFRTNRLRQAEHERDRYQHDLEACQTERLDLLQRLATTGGSS